MTRPLQQPNVLDDPSRHWPFRPLWTCDADGQDWPCGPLRRHMVATMSAQNIGLSMGAYYRDAIRELDVPPAEVHARMFGWIRTAHANITASAAKVRR